MIIKRFEDTTKSGNQKPSIEKQTIQWPTGKGQKDKQ